jgi:hypothetical protein
MAHAVSLAPRQRWLFSAPVDLAVFLGSALVALFLVALGAPLGLLNQDETPDWTWITAVLLIDVAHVWATGFRVYFDPVELRRRPLVYALVPFSCFLLGVALYSEGKLLFWRVLAYVAVFHFIRQQYGWVMLYRARARERDRLGWWIDSAAIYLATIYPLLYWHAHLPRRFQWFVSGDFAALPPLVEQVAAPLYGLALGLYVVHSAWLWIHQAGNLGKDVVVLTTAVCWYVGIIACNSDYAFTVTNVIIHGVPYLALVYWYWRRRMVFPEKPGSKHLRYIVMFLATVWLLAYVEELLWDRGVWHDRSWLFGSSWPITDSWLPLLVPLLALPQVTHYVLDGFIWRRRSNPAFAKML